MNNLDTNQEKFEYILAANGVATELYRISKETLMESDNHDFMVYRFSNWDEVLEELEEWEDYLSITETVYHQLYGNLCIKLRKLYVKSLKSK